MPDRRGPGRDRPGQPRPRPSACSPRSRHPPELGVAAVAERAEFGLFAAVDHPLAGLERVSERDLSEWRLLRLNTYSETGAAINDGLPSSGGRCWSAPVAAGNGHPRLRLGRAAALAGQRLRQRTAEGVAGVRLAAQPGGGCGLVAAALGPAANWLLDRLLDRDLPIWEGPAEPRFSRRSRRRRGRRVPRRWTGDRGSDCDGESARSGG